MLTFAQFIEEIAQKDLVIPAAEVSRLKERFGDKVSRLGHLRQDGSMLVPVDCVVEAAQSLGAAELSEAAETLRNGEIVNLAHSDEMLLDRIGDARERKLRKLILDFQSGENSANQQWRQIEKTVFGVDYPD